MRKSAARQKFLIVAQYPRDVIWTATRGELIEEYTLEHVQGKSDPIDWAEVPQRQVKAFEELVQALSDFGTVYEPCAFDRGLGGYYADPWKAAMIGLSASYSDCAVHVAPYEEVDDDPAWYLDPHRVDRWLDAQRAATRPSVWDRLA